MQPRGGDRKAMTIFNALIARSRFMRLPTAQPMSSQSFAIGSRTTGEGRECRSRSETLSAIGPRTMVERQIQPPLAGPGVTDIARPFLVGFFRDEVLLQQVRCDVEGVVAVCASSGKSIASHLIPRIKCPLLIPRIIF
jgi:hypothetical protein